MKKRIGMYILMLAAIVATLILQGCGGGGSTSGVSTISGTVSDINRNVLIGARVWVDSTHETESLASGAYRLDNVESDWTTIRASATVNGETWVGSTAAYVLWNEPTMNINIVLAPSSDTCEIGGVVRDDTGHRVDGARVLITTRILSPHVDTSSYDGPYGSIVAITDTDGSYLLEDVPAGISATISASYVGFSNDEIEINNTSGDQIDFSLDESNIGDSPVEPILVLIESWTMPDTITRSDMGAFRAVKAFRSPMFRKAVAAKNSRKQAIMKATPAGSLIEIDLYWNALDENDSHDIAGYGIYRATSQSADKSAIDFIRDPYANFYGDTGAEITPNHNYYYAITSVNVQFLDANNNFDYDSESYYLSNTLSIAPLGQLQAGSPAQGASGVDDPTFSWTRLTGATSYTVYVYDEFPALPLDPSYDYSDDPNADAGVLPVWPRQANPDESTVNDSTTSLAYGGPALISGHTYYWLILASDGNGAYSYSQLRHFTP